MLFVRVIKCRMPAWYELRDLTLWSLNRELDLKLDMCMWTPGGIIVKILENLMNLQSKFGYYKFGYPNFQYNTWYVSGTELRTCKRTDDPITRCPRQTFLARGSMFHIHVLYSYCNLALMQALTIYLITRYDIAVIIFIWFMFFDRHYDERTWYLHFQISSFG